MAGPGNGYYLEPGYAPDVPDPTGRWHEPGISETLLSGGVSPTLGALTLSAASFTAGVASGTLIGTISGLTAGSTVTFTPNDGRVAVGSGSLVVGLSASSAGTISGNIVETLAGASNSPRSTPVTITVNAAAVSLPYPARVAFAGNSIMSQAVSANMRSQQLGLIQAAGGRIVATEAADQGIGGTNLTADNVSTNDNIAFRAAIVAAQKPDLIMLEGGHNDNPGASPSTVITAQRACLNAYRSANPNAVIIYQTVYPTSSEGSNSTQLANLASVNADRMNLNGTDGGKTIVVDVHTGFDYASMTHDGIHPNRAGRAFLVSKLIAALSPLLPAATIDSILGEVTASGDHGPNLSTKFALPGTGGAVGGSGTAPTGSVATGMLVTNTTTATVTCSKDVQSGYERQVIDITGSVSTEGYVEFGDGTLTNRVTTNAIPGEYHELLFAFALSATDGSSAPVGVRAYGSILPYGVAAYSLGNYRTTDATIQSNVDTAITAGLSRSYARPIGSALTLVQGSFGVRLVPGTVDVRLIVWKPIQRRTFLTARAPLLYVGNDKIKGAAEQVGLNSGTVANGNSIVFRPGAFAGGGGASIFTGSRIYSGGSTTTGSGTLLATLGAGVWSWTASGLTSGTPIYFETDAANGNGAAVTARSAAIAVP